LSKFFNGSSEKDYAIISGPSGIGKTFLVNGLANDFNVPLFLVDSMDYRCKEDINDLKKTLNVSCFGYGHSKKIILVDNLFDFTKYCQKQLMENVVKISNNPIIFIITEKELYKLNKTFRKNGIVLKLKKPTHTELLSLLKDKAKEFEVKLSDDDILEIAKKCPSVRASINSLYTSTPSELFMPDYTNYEKFKQMKEQKLEVDVDKYFIKRLGISTEDYRTLNLLKTMNEKTDIMFKQTIDKFMFNHYPYLKLPNYNDLKYRPYINKSLDKEKKKLCEDLHISAKVFREEYKFLSTNENNNNKKKKEVKFQKQTRKGEPNVRSLHDFF